MAPSVSVHVSAVKRTVVSRSVVLLDPSDRFGDLHYLWNFHIVFCTYVQLTIMFFYQIL